MDLLTAIKERRKKQALVTCKEVTLTNGAIITVNKLGPMQRKQCQIDAYKKLNIPMTDDFKPDLNSINFGGFQEVDFIADVETIIASCPQFSDKKILKELGYKNSYDFMNGELEEEDFDILRKAIIDLAVIEKEEHEAVEEVKNS